MVSKNTSLFAFREFLFAIGLVFLSQILFAQDSASVKQTTATNYFKIEVGMHILDCPVLPARLKEKISKFNGMKNYYVSVNKQYIIFDVPEGVTSIEQLKA